MSSKDPNANDRMEASAEVTVSPQTPHDAHASPSGPPGPESGETLYQRVARGLIDEIRSGKHPVGSLLSTETELAQSLGVSRQTVRQALAELRDLGLISAKRGVGTRVESTRPTRRFNFSSRSVNDLINFASHTQLVLVSRQRFVSNEAIESSLGIPAGARWMHYGCLRQAIDDASPFCWTDIYLDARFSDLMGRASTLDAPVFARIEQQEGRSVGAINQDIRAVILGAGLTEHLGTEPDAPGLEIRRRYFLGKDELFEVSINTIPADRYQFSLELDLAR